MAAAQSAAATRRILGEVTPPSRHPLCPLGCNGRVRWYTTPCAKHGVRRCPRGRNRRVRPKNRVREIHLVGELVGIPSGVENPCIAALRSSLHAAEAAAQAMTCRRTALFALLAAPASAFYLPGVAPHDYQHGEKVDMKVNKLSSTKTQVRPCPLHALP